MPSPSELSRQYVAAFNAGDLDALMALVDQSVDFKRPDEERLLTRSAVRSRYAEDWSDHAQVHLHVERLMECGSTAVIEIEVDAGPPSHEWFPRGRNSSTQHDSKCHNDECFRYLSKTIVITDSDENVGDIFKYSHHGYRIVLERHHAGKEHETKEDIDGCPHASRSQIEIGIFDPLHEFTQFDTNDGHNGLKDYEKDIQISIRKVIVTAK